MPTEEGGRHAARRARARQGRLPRSPPRSPFSPPPRSPRRPRCPQPPCAPLPNHRPTDNNYWFGSAATIQRNVGQHYSWAIRDDPATNRFWPVPGNHVSAAPFGGWLGSEWGAGGETGAALCMPRHPHARPPASLSLGPSPSPPRRPHAPAPSPLARRTGATRATGQAASRPISTFSKPSATRQFMTTG